MGHHGARFFGAVLILLLPATSEAEAPRLQWKSEWARFRPAEYAFTIGAGALTPLLIWALPDPPPGWDQPLLFDRSFRSALMIESHGTQRRVQIASDIIQNTLVIYPLVVDAGVAALLVDRSWDVAAQLALIDIEAFVLQGLLVAASKRTVGRVRPGLEPCPDGTFSCRSNSQRRSFISGHAAATFTGASLLCLHHRQLALYGSGVADRITCGAAIALALTDGLLRIASDDHHATDVLASSALGVAAGYVVPYLLHYAGPTDGRLDGMLHLGGVAGPSALAGRTRFATGVAVDLRQWWWWDDEESIGLALAGSGLLTGTKSGHYFREGRASLMVWAHGFAIGPALSYRAEAVPSGQDSDQLAVGGSIAFGLLAEDTALVLETTWLPLAQGYSDLIEASLEGALFRYAMASIRFRRSIPSEQSAGGSMVLFTLGGRLPW